MRIHPDLPIFHLDNLRLPILYTPGTLAVVERDDAELIRQIRSGHESPADYCRVEPQMTWMADHARTAVRARTEWLDEEFAPECLTVYLSNLCNLRCAYCYADIGRDASLTPPIINEDSFRSAADFVARNCLEKKLPFRLVLHGGGEPAIHWDLVCRLAGISQSIAKRYGIEWSGHIATNGAMPVEHAKWLGATFQSVGLSCDGPPDIQDRQRPLCNGGPTSWLARRTARAVRDGGAQLEVRTTITPQTVHRQQEILLYLMRELETDTVRFEPEYAIQRQGGKFAPQDADVFAGGFMEARRAALALGGELRFAGIRLDECHGPYCNVLRQTLHLTPDGNATACFFCVDGRDPMFQNRIIGEPDRISGKFRIHSEKIAKLRNRAARIPNACQDCFACYHCARSCPEICSAQGDAREAAEPSFRCLLNKAIGQRLIQEAAEDLIRNSVPEPGAHHSAIPNEIKTLLETVPPVIKDRVLGQYLAAIPKYNMAERGLPSPIWEEKGFQFDSEQTWRQLRRIIAESPPDPVSVYVHLPFCDTRCAFCDCHAIKTSPGHPLRTEYTHWLIRNIRLWAEIGDLAARPVTTVHFGGGTPNCLDPVDFEAIVSALAKHFNVGPETELALESTSSLLAAPHLSWLKSMGFRRLHIGIQTLEEPLRHHIGRRESARTVIEKLRQCLEFGFITTVDLVYGLPGETVSGFFSGVDRLIGSGAHGISLYRFNRSKRNRRFSIAANENALHDYAKFLVADQMMLDAGYEKNHFTHYAKHADRNLYYTHTRRGEDLLSLGASADGVFAGLHYRYPYFHKNMLRPASRPPVFQGGVMETPKEQKISETVARLMAGSINQDAIDNPGLLGQWRVHQMVKRDSQREDLYRLTGNGSWFIRPLVREVRKWAWERLGRPEY